MNKEATTLNKSMKVFGYDGKFGSYQLIVLFAVASNLPNYGIWVIIYKRKIRDLMTNYLTYITSLMISII